MISFDSNISAELFAAYIDGNTSPHENSLIEKAMLQDEDLFLAKGIVSSAINGYDTLDGFYPTDNYSSEANINNNAQDCINVLDSDENEIIDSMDDEEDDYFPHSPDADEDSFDDDVDEKEDI